MNTLQSTRVAAIEAIDSLMEKDPRIAMVFADSVKVFRAAELVKKYPDRCFDVGIAEQNAVTVAAGMASSGLKPIVATYAGFLTMRACEQIRTFVAYPRLPVIFLGANGGIAGGEREGVTHQFIEDLGIARTLPSMSVVSPADAYETHQAVLNAAKQDGPVYIRIGSGRDPVFFEQPYSFEWGKAHIVLEQNPEDVVIFATGGFLLHRCWQAIERLNTEGFRVSLLNIHTLKPLDADTVGKFLKRAGAAVTVEDHTVIGGLGSAIAEAASEQFPVPLIRLGLQDTFAESGEAEALLDAYGMGVPDICDAVKKVLQRKG
ncbi:MAG: transketolase [Spirochaetes bacterium]|nr:transketolase [Spirochaetota bacterium]